MNRRHFLLSTAAFALPFVARTADTPVAIGSRRDSQSATMIEKAKAESTCPPIT